MNHKKHALSAFFWTTLQQSLSQGFAFIVSIILARMLNPSDYGQIGIMGIFISLGFLLTDSGMTHSLIRSKIVANSDYSTVFFFNLALSFIIYFIIFFLAPAISKFYQIPSLTSLIRVYCLTFLINAFSVVQYTILNKEMHFKKEFIVFIPSIIISGGIAIYLAYAGFGVWSLVYNTLLQSLITTIILWQKSQWRPKLVFDINIFKYHFNFGYKLTLSGIIDTLFSNVYSIFIGKYFTLSQLGFYNRADSLKQLPVSNISVIINKVAFPLFVKLDSDIELKIIFRKILVLLYSILTPLIFFLITFADDIILFLFSEKWVQTIPYFRILCISGYLFPLHSYNLNLLKLKGYSNKYLKIEILKKIIFILVFIISTFFGIYGLLYGTVLISILSFFINAHFTSKIINYSSLNQIFDILPFVAISFFISLIFYSLKFSNHQNIIFRLIVNLIIFSFSYFLMILFFQKNLLSELKKILAYNK